MTEKTKTLIIAAFVLLSGLAAWGWMRKPTTATGANYSQPLIAQPAAYDPDRYAGSGPSDTRLNYRSEPEPLYASRDYVRTLRHTNYTPGDYAPAYDPNGSISEERDRAAQHPTYSRYLEPRYVDHGSDDRAYQSHDRPAKKSAMIVAGSAAGGAAIGAIVGGGKGAGIGAAAGGVSGLIYDRLTHKH